MRRPRGWCGTGPPISQAGADHAEAEASGRQVWIEARVAPDPSLKREDGGRPPAKLRGPRPGSEPVERSDP
jgi:hypothetical protein